jgi:hypothetical protein
MPTTILATRFNNLQDRLDAVLGTSGSAAPTFGYGQTLNAALDVAGTRANTLPNSDKITAQQYEDLYIDIVRCRAHQVGAAAVTIDDFVIGDFETNAANTDKVEEAYISALESLMTTIELNRFDIDIATQATTALLTTAANVPISSTYTNSVNGSWTNFLNQIFTVTFPTVEDRRHFFNAGGEIRFNAEVAYTGAQQKTADWQSSMAAMGVISFTADDTYSNSSVGSASNIGNNSLTSTYQLCYRNDAGTTYSQSAYELYALQTGPRTIQFKVFFTDPNPGGWSIDEPVFGDWTSSASLLIPDGSVTINGITHNTVVIESPQLPSGSNIVNLSANPPPVPSYNLSRSTSAASEGNSATITLATGNVSNGTTIPYTITGVTTSDINIPLQGNFVVGVTNSVTITFANDLLTEGTETLTLALNNGASTISVNINDTSLTPPAAGTLLNQYCSGYDLYGNYADGSGGYYAALIQTNSATCGYVPPFTFSITPTAYLTQNTAWDIGDVVINTTATTNITITAPAGVRSGVVTVQSTSRPSEWAVAVDDVSSATTASKNYNLAAGQSITVPISVTPASVLDFAAVNRQFDFTVLEATGAGPSYKVYWTGAGVPVPLTPNINTTLNVDKVIGNETTSNTFTFSGTVTGWESTTGSVSWQQVGDEMNANDFINGTTGTAPVTITNSPNTGDGTYSFTRSIRADSTTEGTEEFGTRTYLASTPTVQSQTRFVSVSDTSDDPPVAAQFSSGRFGNAHTFSIAPTETTTWTTSVSLTSAPNNNPVELTVRASSWYNTWNVTINGSVVAVAGGASAMHTFSITPGQSETITISVTATDGPHNASTGQLVLYQGSGTSGSPILDRHYYTGTTTAWAAPVIQTAGFSPPNPIVGTPASLYYTTSNATQVDYLITGSALPAGLAVTYDNGLTPDALYVNANVDDITFTDEGTANWQVIASTPDGQTATASGQLTTTLIEPTFSVSLPNGTSYTEGDTITFSLRYKNATASTQSFRFYRNPSIGDPVGSEYSTGGNGITFSGLSTAQDNVFRTATATITSVVDSNIEGTEGFKLSDETGVPSYATWTLTDQPIANTFVITPSSVPVGSLFTFNSTGTPNTTVTYTAASVPDYNQQGSSFTLNSSGSYTRSSLHTLPGDFTYVGTFPVGSPSTATATVKICPVLSITMDSTALPGDSVAITISGGLRNGYFFWGHDQAAGGVRLRFNNSGVASFNFNAGSPATYTYTVTEEFCSGTASATLIVQQVYSPSASVSPASPYINELTTLNIVGGRPGGSFNITGPHPVSGVSFNSEGRYTTSSAYSTAGTFNYVIAVPSPDTNGAFTIVVQNAPPPLYTPNLTLIQPSTNESVTGAITGALPNGSYAWASTNNAAGGGASSGTLDGAGNGTFSYTRSDNTLSTYASVSFQPIASYAAGYNAINYTLAGIAAPLPLPTPTISWTATASPVIQNVTNATLSWNAGADAATASTVIVDPNGGSGTVPGLTYNTTSVLALPGTYTATITATNSTGSATESASITVVSPEEPPEPTIQFLSATYTVGETIQAAVNPDSAGGTYSSYSYIRNPSNTIIADSQSISPHTLSATATTTGTHTAGMLVLYRGNSNEQLSVSGGPDSTSVSAPAGTGSISFDQSSYYVGETLAANYTTSNANSVTATISKGGTPLVSTTTKPNGSLSYEALTAGTYGVGLSVNNSVVSTDTVSVGVLAPVINSFYWSPASIEVGDSNTLYWNVTGATSIVVTGDTGTYSLGPSGTRANGPYLSAGNFNTTLTAYNAGGTVTATAPITVTAPAPAAPSISFGPQVGIINDTQYTLTWTANSVGVSSPSIAVTDPNGTVTSFTTLTGSYTSTLGVQGIWSATITTAGGTASASVTVNNAPEAPPAVGTLLSTYCVGTTQWGIYSGGYGPDTSAIIQTNSISCGYTPPPPAAGTVLSSNCSGTTLVQQIADGSGGSNTVETPNSTECGYTPPLSYTVTISVFVGPYNGSTSLCTAYFTGTPGASYGWSAGGSGGSGTFNSAGADSISAALPSGTYFGAIYSGGQSASTSWTVGGIAD